MIRNINIYKVRNTEIYIKYHSSIIRSKIYMKHERKDSRKERLDMKVMMYLFLFFISFTIISNILQLFTTVPRQ